MNHIDLNCDLGEGMETDGLIMPYLTSCNISCGAHAGDRAILAQTLIKAKQYSLKIGAHPSYPDRENFGRMDIPMSLADLEESLLDQLLAFQMAAIQSNVTIHHIKPHGALYHQAAKSPDTAKVILKIMQQHFPHLILFAPPSSVISLLAKEYGISVWSEAFADRNYADDLSLIPRSHAEALKMDILDILAHIDNMMNQHQVVTLSGKSQPIKADTICIHGDHPHAESIAKAIHQHWNANL
ncbi:5-oxoprolinase subunit PxpA [Anditalea andensis]|uniref:LamB/YcsF family protein n=1 Tax=Anditalea andensis TaxID=1048983 RepID=A0A074L0W3_9BACT|nr:5-oxoprolinase subunit PxpA [Anditalea andensis]KEO75881.1 LamB/YcsF family protein [Anditalea andensis]